MSDDARLVARRIYLLLTILCFFFVLSRMAHADEAQPTKVLRYYIPDEGFIDSDSNQTLDDAMKFIEDAHVDGVAFVRAKPWQDYDFAIKISRLQMLAKDRNGLLRSGQIIEDRSESATYVFHSHPKGPIVVQLLWDVLIAEPQSKTGKRRANVPSAVIAALAREIYGSVLPLMDRKIELAVMAMKLEKQTDYVALLPTDQWLSKWSQPAAILAVAGLLGYAESRLPHDPLTEGLQRALDVEKARLLAIREAAQAESKGRALAFVRNVQCEQIFAGEK